MPGPDIQELERQSKLFAASLNRIKAALAPQRIIWYPYPTMGAFPILDKLITGPRRRVVDLAAGDPILDLGCADGGISFFFESLGCEVCAVDNPHTNHNQMRGFEALRAALNSSVSFEAVDLDSQFKLPQDIFGLAIFLGVLYHLKNPYYVLEALSRHARYCLLSTRIAQRTPKSAVMKDEPLAYFLAPGETNNDATNYWIFSEPALSRLLDRTGWNICDFQTTGATYGSEPARADPYDRTFCLLESRNCPPYSIRLLEGSHPLPHNRFPSTYRRFSLQIPPPH